ncbi:MAG: FapA family protein [Ruminococcus sp.]|jgi:uncharacterized protein (DUF342 family)|nr:FapA family protein [Ruminococcus sp.]
MEEEKINNVDAKKTEPPIDFKINVLVSSNYSSASIYIIPPKNGGEEVTPEAILSALKDNNVVFGIDKEKIAEICVNKLYDTDHIVAKWQASVNGVNGEISYKFEKFTSDVPVEDEAGFVDYKMLGTIRNIYKDTVIAEIELPTPGEVGYDVRGQELLPKPGSKASYVVGSGTVLNEEGTLISALVDGALFFEGGAFVVRKDVTIKSDIDFKTGNIDFIGDVTVSGDVFEGFKVSSSGGNVTIKGAVYSAVIEAKGDVEVKKGANHAKLTAGANIRAHFCEYCDLHANGDIDVQTLILSNAYCGGTLTTKGSSGGLVGGRYTIITGAQVNNIGSPHYPITEVTLGNNAVLANERLELTASIENRNNEIRDLTLIIDYLNNKKKADFKLPPEKEEILGNAVRTRLIKNRDIAQANKRIDEINNILANKQDLKLEVKGTIYPKTKIIINSCRNEVNTEWKHVTVFIDEDNEFHFAPM